MTDKTFLAVIPARGGSKGIQRKNIVDVAGKPLLAWTIEAARKSKYVSKTVVSSEDSEILNISLHYGALAIKRPLDLASDEASSEVVVLDAIVQLEDKGEWFDYVALLQPTSPLRTSDNIDNAIDLLIEKDANALISVYKPAHSPYKALVVKQDGYIEGLFKNGLSFRRRQDLPDVLMPNGAIYIVRTIQFKESGSLCPDKTIPFIMLEEDSCDLDTGEDLEKISKYLNVRK